MRKLIGDSESPLFTRFGEIPMDPFGGDATNELATKIWEGDATIAHDPDAAIRLHKLSGGWPLYVNAIAQKARLLARGSNGRITHDTIDLAFRQELFGRGTDIGQHCAYLRQTATQSDSDAMKSLLENVLDQVAAHEPLTRGSLVQRLSRRHNYREAYRAINRLIDTDFLKEEGGVLTLLDPIFTFWLAAEPARQDPQGVLSNQTAAQKLVSWFEQRHAEDRTAMGTLFEKRVENLVRQFGGQEVDGGHFGISERVVVPRARRIQRIRVDDPQGLYGNDSDSYEIEIVTTGDHPEDCWAVECKHRKGAVTVNMVNRFVQTARAVEKAKGIVFHRLWIVSNRGIRGDAASLARAEGILMSGSRQIEQLERLALDGAGRN